jgi:spore coat protein U-like protein
MTPFRALFVAMVATVLLVGARSGAEAQFPRGLLAAPPGEKDKPNNGACTIETRPLSFGNFDPEANADLDAVAQVIYTCDQHASKIRIEMTTGAGNQFTPRHMYASGVDALDYNIYLDATRQTIWGQGLYGTDVYFESNPPNGTPVIVPAYGRIFARQSPSPPPGQYLDVLTVRVLF